MNHRTAAIVYPCLIGLTITLAAWPLFVLTGSVFGQWLGEARQLDAWALEPKRALLSSFLDGWRASLVVGVPLGLLAAIDHRLLSTHRSHRWIEGLSLPLATASLAPLCGLDPSTALPTLLVSGVLLAIVHRSIGQYRRWSGRRNPHETPADRTAAAHAADGHRPVSTTLTF